MREVLKRRLTENGEKFTDNFASVVSEFFELETYVGNDQLFMEQTKRQNITDIVAEASWGIVRDVAWKNAREGDYAKAISQVREFVFNLKDEGYSHQDNRAIRIFALRRIGRIYEHWATYGEKNIPLSNIDRKTHFLLGAYYYMLGDIELGVMTEYAGRASECLRGFGAHDLGSQFDQAFFGNNILYSDDPNSTDVKIYTSNGSMVDEESSSGGKVQKWEIDIPDVDLN